MDPLLDALLAWIGDNTAYDVSDIPRPALMELSPEELTRELYADAPQLIPEDGVDDRLIALYSHQDGAHGTLYVLEPEHVAGAAAYQDPTDNPVFQEIVLHELIHHVQWQNGAPETWPCPSRGEEEAYMLGGRFLLETNTPDTIPNRAFWAQAYSTC